MKLKYLLAGMLLLTPLASQATKGKVVINPAVVIRTPVPCKGKGCVTEVPAEGRVTPKAEKTQVFGHLGIFQSVLDGVKGLSEEGAKLVKELIPKVVVVTYKTFMFFSRSASAQGQELVVSQDKMIQAITNAVSESPKWRDPVAQNNLKEFINGIYIEDAKVLPVMKKIWDINTAEEAREKLVEIEQACAI